MRQAMIHIAKYALSASILFSFLITPAVMYAQRAEKDSTLNRTVVVEQEYNPDIMDASKVNILPAIETPTVSKKSIEYATSLLPVTSFGSYSVMKPFIDDTPQANVTRGYARLGYGNYGNLDAKLNYLFNLTKKDRLGASVSADGMDGRLKIQDQEPWKAYYYRTRFDLTYVHLFNQVSLDLTGNYGIDNFNYLSAPTYLEESIDWLPTTGGLNNAGVVFDKQSNLKGSGHIGMQSIDETLPFQFSAEVNYLSFNKKYELPEGKLSNKEDMIRTLANFYGLISDEQKVGLNFSMNNVFYSRRDQTNYTHVALAPYYTYQNESFRLKAGASVNFSSGQGKKFQAAPNVELNYIFADTYNLYLKLDGGSIINDYRRMEEFCPYVNPSLHPVNSFNQLDALLGFKAQPFPGFWFNLFAGYQQVTDDLFLVPDLNVSTHTKQFNLLIKNSKHLLYGGELKYKYKEIVDVSLKATAYNWKNRSDEDALLYLMKPKTETTFKISLHPIKNLSVGLGYKYIGWHTATLNDNTQEMGNINNLSLDASYHLFKGISIYAKVDNILNKTYQYYRYYPTEGANFLGGLSFRF